MKNNNQSFNQLIYERLCEEGKSVEIINDELYYESLKTKAHNKITLRLAAKLDEFFYDKKYDVYSEQIEVILEESKVKPDIFVVCPENEIIETKGESIVTVPTLIMEVVSKGNASLDTLTKMELYARYGVKEYCLVYQDGSIVQLILEENLFKAIKVYNKEDVYKSKVFNGLEIDLKRIFYGI